MHHCFFTLLFYLLYLSPLHFTSSHSFLFHLTPLHSTTLLLDISASPTIRLAVGEIKKTQVLMASPEWGIVAQEERTRILERHEGPLHARSILLVRYTLPACVFAYYITQH